MLTMDAFQSTLPTRGETYRGKTLCHQNTFQSTLPTRGETKPGMLAISIEQISIHSPHAGRDIFSASMIA